MTRALREPPKATTLANGASVAREEPWPYKMADLCRLTGLPRQAVHFYIQEGLVPPGRKMGPNNARYGDVHVERIRVVRQLQNERFMPLKAIRAVIDGRDEAFTAGQHALLADVKRRLAGTLAKPRRGGRRVEVRALLARHGLDQRDLDDLVGSGVIEVEPGPRGALRAASEDAWAFELLGSVRRAGFTRELGFDAKLLRVYERAVTSLVDREWRALSRRLSDLPPEQVANMLEQAMPLVHEFFSRYHAKKVRDFFASTA